MEPESESEVKRNSMETIKSLMGSLTKDFLAMANVFPKLRQPEGGNANYAFSPAMLAVALYLVSKASIAGAAATGNDEEAAVKEELRWFLDSTSNAVVVPELIEHFFFKATGNDLRFHFRFWFTNVGLLNEGVSAAQERAFREVLEGNILGFCSCPVYVNEKNATQDLVNAWAKDKTNGLINEGFLPCKPLARRLMLLTANLVDFRGTWAEKFDASDPTGYDFYVKGGHTVKVPYMTSKKPQLIGIFDGFKVLGIPYLRNWYSHEYCMYILLPDARDGLADLMEKISSGAGFLLNDHILLECRKLNDFWIPMFKISFGFHDPNGLKLSSLKDAFLSVSNEKQVAEGTEELTRSSFPSTSTSSSNASHSATAEGEQVVVDTENWSPSNSLETSFSSISLGENESTGKQFPTSLDGQILATFVPGIYNISALQVGKQGARFASASCVSSESLSTDRIDFVADHPFLFMIKEDSGFLLFIGQVVDPSAG